MIPAAPAIHYTVTVMCGESPCALPVRAEMFAGGGSPTPVPPSFTHIRLRITPQPNVMPIVRWQSHDENVVIARFTSPLEGTLRFGDDTSATPEPDYLDTLLVPGTTKGGRFGDATGTTTVDAVIGAPVNETVSIPVYAAGIARFWTPPLTKTNTRLVVHAAPASAPTRTFKTSITYADPVAPTYGAPNTLFAEIPWPQGAGGFIQTFGSVRVAIEPLPYSKPPISWSVDGDSVSISERTFGAGPLPATDLRGVHPGTATLRAHIGAPVNEDASMSVVTYRTFVLSCRNGVRFMKSGDVEFTTDVSQSDLFLDCGSLRVPEGGVLVTNGTAPDMSLSSSAIRGPQFPDLGPALWRNAFTILTLPQYRAAMPAHTLLFRTRDGRYVKWLLQTGNGLDALAGPYQVL